MIAMPRLLACGATLLAALILTIGDADARWFQVAGVQKDLDQLVELLRAKKVNQAKVKAQVAAMQKNHELEDIMKVYKPTKSKGIGWNPAKKGVGDGIESRIFALGTKQELTQAQLQAEKGLLLRTAYYNLALFEINKAFGPPKQFRKVAKWHAANAEMKSGSEGVITSVKANDPAALKKAMAKIGSGCTHCHALFTDPVKKDLEDLFQLLHREKVDRPKVNALIATMKTNHALDEIMAKVYKPTHRMGIGFDPAKQNPGDGIEKRLSDLGTRRELTKAELLAEKDLLLRAAYYNLTIYEVTKAFAPAKAKGPRNPIAWNRHNDEIKAGTEKMIAAIEANDPKTLKKALGRVNASCNECHSIFR